MAKRGLERVLAEVLLAWYDSHGRNLPWREKPGAKPDPYRVWLSEIMLQQTTVKSVRAYFETFVRQWPSVEALAAAPLDDVLKAWAGLGYYARARNLHACAREVAFNRKGRFPDSEAELRKLPGIGPYTSAAMAAIAFGQPLAAIDGNVERVVSRFFAIEAPLPAAKPAIRKRAEALVPRLRAGDFAQALMDLGATVCTPKSPNCPVCPWAEQCRGRRRGIAATLPRKPARKAVPIRRGVAYWLERDDGAVLLRKRPARGLLGGMIEVPSSGWNAHAIDEPPKADWHRLPGLVEHTFSHFHLKLLVMKAKCLTNPRAAVGYRWVSRKNLHAEALPTVMRKVVAHVLGEG